MATSDDLRLRIRCPLTRQPLARLDEPAVLRLNERIEARRLKTHSGDAVEEALDGGFISQDGAWITPVRGGILRMLIDEVIAAPRDAAPPTRSEGDAMSEKTIFKKIIDGEIPADLVHDDEHCLAFRDIDPKAPTHVLVIPKKEIASIDEIAEEDKPLLGHMWLVIRQIAQKLELGDGYRVVVNCGPDGGQSVDHLHFHILGGRRLTWPPG